jgi:hypothetical protein
MSTTDNSNSSQEGWDKADLFFLADALKRGMSIEEIARFLNRSEGRSGGERAFTIGTKEG